MRKVKLPTGLAVLIGVLFVAAPPAFAEFTSQNGGSSQGKAEIYKTTLEAGGATVTCHAPAEEESKATWGIVNKEGKAQTKGPAVQLKIVNWGKCQAKVIGLKETAAKFSACDFELQQPKDQSKLTGKIVQACTITISFCEIKIPSKSNQEITAFEAGSNGDPENNVDISPSVTNLVTEVNAGCEALGIKATKTGAFCNNKSGVICSFAQLAGILLGNMSEFLASAIPQRLSTNGQTATVTFTRIGGTAGMVMLNNRVTVVEDTTRNLGMSAFEKVEPGFNNCKSVFVYELTLANKKCSFQVRRLGPGEIIFKIGTTVNGVGYTTESEIVAP